MVDGAIAVGVASLMSTGGCFAGGGALFWSVKNSAFSDITVTKCSGTYTSGGFGGAAYLASTEFQAQRWLVHGCVSDRGAGLYVRGPSSIGTDCGRQRWQPRYGAFLTDTLSIVGQVAVTRACSVTRRCSETWPAVRQVAFHAPSCL